MRRLSLFLVLIVLVVPLFVVHGQPTTAPPLDGTRWLPADTAAVITVPLADLGAAERTLNLLTFFGTLTQPSRIAATERLPLRALFPFTTFDAEGDPLRALAGWVTGDMVIGYAGLETDFTATADQIVVVLPTRDALAAAAGLGAVLRQQDFLVSTTIDGFPVYTGDQAVFAFAPEAVIIGPRDRIDAVLAVRRGDAPALADDPAFVAIAAETAAALPNAFMFLYAAGDAAAAALPFVLGATADGAALLPALGQTIPAFSLQQSALTHLLAGDVSAVGARLRPDTVLIQHARAAVMVQFADTVPAAPISPAADLLAYLPRQGFAVVQGTDARTAAAGAFAALPLANFAPLIVGGFPVGQTAGSLGALPPPSAETLQAVTIGFADALRTQAAVEINDLLAGLTGNYAAALLARPNDPTPILNTPVDLLLIAASSDADAAADQLVRGLSAVIGGEPFATATIADVPTRTISADGEPVLRIAAHDGAILIGTGTAVDAALAAAAGDNRLIDQPRWEQMRGERGLTTTPNAFIDLAAFYSVFVPEAAGEAGISFGTIGITARDTGSDRYLIDVLFQLTPPR